ncbi:MAG: sugar phosphate isomerase/epimerase family protein [Chloroflexota bacterium]
MKIAGHTLGTPGMSLQDALSLFARAELDAAEIIWQDGYPAAIPESAGDAEARAISHVARDLHLEVACLTPYMSGINSLDDRERDRDIERFRRCLRMAEMLDCHRVRVYAGSHLAGEEASRDPKWARLVAALAELASDARRAGVILAVENHFNTMTVSAAESAALMRAVGSGEVGILYDQANLAFTYKETSQDAIPLQRPWICHVHVKDLVFVEGQRDFRAGTVATVATVATVEEDIRNVRSRVVGEGVIDWSSILADLAGGGYDGYLSLEYEYRWHPADLPEPAEGFRRSAERLRAMLAEIAG